MPSVEYRYDTAQEFPTWPLPSGMHMAGSTTTTATTTLKLKPATEGAMVSDVRIELQQEVSRIDEELQRLRKRNAADGDDDADMDGEDDEVWDDGLLPSTDPFACFCICNFPRLGHNYILRERRTIVDGEVKRDLVIVGPHWIGVVVTVSITLVGTFFFIKQQCLGLPWHYTLITLGFCGITLYSLYQAACLDPGIVPPRRHLKATADAEADAATELEQGNSNSSMSVGPGPRIPNRASMRLFCDICGIQQERDTEHCEDCGVCVEEYDHHCPWMGKCIGKKNMPAFKRFNICWVLYVVFVLYVSIQNVDWSDVTIRNFHRAANGQWIPTATSSTDHNNSPRH